MKIAFFTYPSAFQNVGGGEILLLKLRQYLQKEGLEVHLFDSWNSKIENYQVLHVFGSVKDCLGLVQVAKTRGVKVAITPLFWSDLRRALFTDGSIGVKAEFLARHFTKMLWPSFPSSRRRLLAASDLIFPNSMIEMRQIARLFCIPLNKMSVVPNGVDPDFAKADPSIFRERYGQDPFVLGVGRVEPRKNQLNLIRAVRRIGEKKLILIGSPVSGYESYFSKCQEEGKGFTLFLPSIAHEDPLLKSAYAACDLFVLQGWFETPGLVAMEAALAGARVVVTKGGSTQEYFENHVYYLDPSKPGDIQEKIIRSLERPRNESLKDHVLRHFTWNKVAQLTVKHYQDMITFQ